MINIAQAKKFNEKREPIKSAYTDLAGTANFSSNETGFK